MVKGSFDFIGLNHYTSKFVHFTGTPGKDYGNDARLWESATDVNGKLIGPYAESSWLNVYPAGFR
jgi:beta-glucosidase